MFNVLKKIFKRSGLKRYEVVVDDGCKTPMTYLILAADETAAFNRAMRSSFRFTADPRVISIKEVEA